MTKATRHSIGRLASLANLPASTIRFYEQVGLLRPSRKTTLSHRRYNDGHLLALKLISRAKTLGMSLEEIKELVALFGRDPMRKEGVARALEILDGHLVHIDKAIKELTVLKKSIREEQGRLRGLLGRR